jgi:C1A family cysteine protease
VVLALVLLKEPFEAAWRNGGIVKMPKLGTKTPSTLHYVLVVGYNRARRHFVFANSWGTAFGSGGFGFVDYDYVTNYAIEGLFVESLRVRS